MKQPIIFISYSHKDEPEKEAVLTHLKVLQHGDSSFDLWSDDRIEAGNDWREEISQAIARARVAVLLISANFLASDFILSNQLPKLLEGRKNKGLIIFPVIIKACAWQRATWLNSLEVIPKTGRPIWANGNSRVDEDLSAIAEEIAKIIEKILPEPLPDLYDDIDLNAQIGGGVIFYQKLMNLVDQAEKEILVLDYPNWNLHNQNGLKQRPDANYFNTIEQKIRKNVNNHSKFTYIRLQQVRWDIFEKDLPIGSQLDKAVAEHCRKLLDRQRNDYIPWNQSPVQIAINKIITQTPTGFILIDTKNLILFWHSGDDIDKHVMGVFLKNERSEERKQISRFHDYFHRTLLLNNSTRPITIDDLKLKPLTFAISESSAKAHIQLHQLLEVPSPNLAYWEALIANTQKEPALITYPGSHLVDRWKNGYGAIAIHRDEIISHVSIISTFSEPIRRQLSQAINVDYQCIPKVDVYECATGWTDPSWRRRGINIKLRNQIIQRFGGSKSLFMSFCKGLAAAPVLESLNWRLVSWDDESCLFVSSLVAWFEQRDDAHICHKVRVGTYNISDMKPYTGPHISPRFDSHAWETHYHLWVSDLRLVKELNKELSRLLDADLERWRHIITSAFSNVGSLNQQGAIHDSRY